MVGLSFAVADLFRVLHLRLNFISPHTIELSRNQWISFENIWLEFELAHQSKRERERKKNVENLVGYHQQQKAATLAMHWHPINHQN